MPSTFVLERPPGTCSSRSTNRSTSRVLCAAEGPRPNTEKRCWWPSPIGDDCSSRRHVVVCAWSSLPKRHERNERGIGTEQRDSRSTVQATAPAHREYQRERQHHQHEWRMEPRLIVDAQRPYECGGAKAHRRVVRERSDD